VLRTQLLLLWFAVSTTQRQHRWYAGQIILYVIACQLSEALRAASGSTCCSVSCGRSSLVVVWLSILFTTTVLARCHDLAVT
jgi:hypothetical protein